MRNPVLAVVLLIASGCAGIARPATDPQPAHLERLYFGRDIGDTGTVSDSAWSRFVDEIITPEFPDGATIWGAIGYWRAPDGTMVQEQSFVVELLHQITPDTEARVLRVIDAYKVRFAQLSVLRVVTDIRAKFYSSQLTPPAAPPPDPPQPPAAPARDSR